MRDLVSAIAAGKIEGEYVIDLNGDEEKVTLADIPLAYMPREGKITLLQMDGNLPKEDVKNIIKLAIDTCKKLYEMQKKVLKEKWLKEGVE